LITPLATFSDTPKAGSGPCGKINRSDDSNEQVHNCNGLE
jgi:hypothetical protein